MKAVETLAIAEFGKPDDSTTNRAIAQWTTRCQPPKIIDLMWHAHVRYAPDEFALLLLTPNRGSADALDAPCPDDTDASSISLRTRLRGNPGLGVRDRSSTQVTIGDQFMMKRSTRYGRASNLRLPGRYTMPEGFDRSVTFPNKATCGLFMTLHDDYAPPGQWQPVHMCTRRLICSREV